MKHYAGIDVSLNSSSVCVVDESGKVVREVKVPSEPVALISWIKSLSVRVGRIGLEAGPPGIFYVPWTGCPGGEGPAAARALTVFVSITNCTSLCASRKAENRVVANSKPATALATPHTG